MVFGSTEVVVFGHSTGAKLGAVSVLVLLLLLLLLLRLPLPFLLVVLLVDMSDNRMPEQE
jgi:hypothetical protein